MEKKIVTETGDFFSFINDSVYNKAGIKKSESPVNWWCRAKIETDFDHSVGIINVVPQDISRVILNLINNALYTVAVKKNQLNGGYQPAVKVSTRRSNGPRRN